MIAAAQEFRKLDFSKAEDLEQARGGARAINQGFGGINRAVDGLTPQQMHWAARTFLAGDYNEGQIRATLGALSKGGVEGKVARQIIGGKIAIFAIPGLIQVGMDPNKRDKPEEWGKALVTQIVDPHVTMRLSNPNGIDKGMTKSIKFAGDPAITKGFRIGQPFFDKNQVTLGDKFSGLQHEAVGNLAALPSMAVQAASNKDYYGNKLLVRNPDGNINLKQSAVNTGLAQSEIPNMLLTNNTSNR
jgi:hypothetical protein